MKKYGQKWLVDLMHGSIDSYKSPLALALVTYRLLKSFVKYRISLRKSPIPLAKLTICPCNCENSNAYQQLNELVDFDEKISFNYHYYEILKIIGD
ncbi:unnamed protein product [Rotaria sordida]|uniref:Uncharacterized protein n=1 Tax=Rotaria sordida TaxID=392033 RepID=A0A819B325_9BILA|nr:unnamed protein product [Rotaria sordida]